MLAENPLMFLISDHWSLSMYRNGQIPNLNDVYRHLMLMERDGKYSVPDHYYRAVQKLYVEGNRDLWSSLFTDKLYSYAKEYLELHNEVIYVKANKFNDWQMQLCWWTPLMLKASVLCATFPFDIQHCSDYLANYIIPNFLYTAIPQAWIPEMEYLKKEYGGLSDLHLHLNGALETDITWQDILSRPDKVYAGVKQSFDMNNRVKEQFDQILPGMEVIDLRNLWLTASSIRMSIYEYIFEHKPLSLNGSSLKKNDFQNYILALSNGALRPNDFSHPMLRLLGKRFMNAQPMALECLFVISVMRYLYDNPNDDTISHLFHYYLLILGQVNGMLVQNCRHYGFEEFQKYTSNGIREESEKQYMRRFHQMAGNHSDNISLIEGRFSPKDSERKNEEMIQNIIKGYENLKECNSHVELNLIAHFIKKADTKPDPFIRHRRLREEINQKSEVLSYMINKKHPAMRKFVGLDVAASELDAPPEVFVEAYKRMRVVGVRHFTYHAGEDFFHLLGGMRTVFEAVEFLDLRNGDRIGHAVACGIEPSVWHNNVGDLLCIPQGEYLDDLIFAHYQIVVNPKISPKLLNLIPRIENKIISLANDIYGEMTTVSSLTDSWLKRKENPKVVMDQKRQSIAKDLYMLYHSAECQKRYQEVIKINSLEIFEEDDLIEMQKIMLSVLFEREIVIETLPTSNVFVGHYHDFSAYHLYRWMMLQHEGFAIPHIVLGSDDDGIFATNIYNEYCHIYTQFVYEHHVPIKQVIDFIKWLIDNSNIYAFKN